MTLIILDHLMLLHSDALKTFFKSRLKIRIAFRKQKELWKT